jgi:hypothetical protein
MSSWDFTNDLFQEMILLPLDFIIGFLGLRLWFSFFRFLGLGLGLRLNKMDPTYVCMS